MLKLFYPYEYEDSVFSIDYEQLFKLGYRGIVFDIDNTLVAHGADSSKEVDLLFQRIHELGFKTLLLSNNNEARILRFNKNIQTLYIAEAGKPAPHSFLKAISKINLQHSEVVVVGDQITFDILGANRSRLPSILVKYIGHEKKEKIGLRRNMERVILWCYSHSKYQHRLFKRREKMKKKKLFCEISPTTYAISLKKEIIKRHIKNLCGKEKFASKRQMDKLPVLISSNGNNMIKRGPGIDPKLQENKAQNIRLACSKLNGIIIGPGETFSFWKIVGKTSRRNGFLEGRVLINGKLVAGVGGGLCNLANTINLLVMDSPLTIVEVHHHSDALAPDPAGVRVPYNAGTSINYNFLDYRFRNDTAYPFQLCLWCEDDRLCAELRSIAESPYRYRLVEEGHHFQLEEDGKYYRVSKIYRETILPTTNEVIKKELVWDNHSEVMFDYSLIPSDKVK